MGAIHAYTVHDECAVPFLFVKNFHKINPKDFRLKKVTSNVGSFLRSFCRLFLLIIFVRVVFCYQQNEWLSICFLTNASI